MFQNEFGWSGYGEASGDMGDLWDDPSLYGGQYQQRTLPGFGALVTAPSGLRLRSEPNTSSATILIMPLNGYVDVLEAEVAPGWHRVEYEGKGGYASAEWLKEGGRRGGSNLAPDVRPSPAPSPSPAPAPPPKPNEVKPAPKSKTGLVVGSIAAAVVGYFLFG